MNPRSITSRSLNPLQLRRPDEIFRPENRDIELPAGGGIGEPRAIAKAYGDLAIGGWALGLRTATLEALAAPATPPTGGLRDQVLHIDTSYSLGFWKPFHAFRFGGPDGKAFGTPGLGGSFGFADPAAGLGFAYAPNRLGFRMWEDPREKRFERRCTDAWREFRRKGLLVNRALPLQLLRLILFAGPAMGLFVLNMLHPNPLELPTVYQSIQPLVDWWITLHLLLFSLFTLLSFALFLGLGGEHGWAASTARLALGAFVAVASAFVGTEGIGMGLMIRGAEGLPAAQQAGVEQAV